MRTMTPFIQIRHFRTIWLAAFLSFTLVACDQSIALDRPTQEYVIEAVNEPAQGEADREAAVEQSVSVLERRFTEIGISLHTIRRDGTDRIVLQVAGDDISEELVSLITSKGELSLKLVDLDAVPENTANGLASPGSEIIPTADGSPAVAVKRIGGISGRFIDVARSGEDPSTRRPVVNISFTERGARRLAEVSGSNVGNPIAVILDGKIVSTPIIMEPIEGGALQISGGFAREETRLIAASLNSGRLPITFEYVEVRTIPEVAN